MADKRFNFQRNTDFAGPTFDPALDADRLSTQCGRVYDTMSDGKWRTLAEISAVTCDPEASISAQLRHLRKPKFGGYTILRRAIDKGLCEYRLEQPAETDGTQADLFEKTHVLTNPNLYPIR